MTADLTEERSTSNITTERLEAETAERLKLEKELQQQQDKVRSLQDMSEKLEMELICAKSDLNGWVSQTVLFIRFVRNATSKLILITFIWWWHLFYWEGTLLNS